MSATFRVPERIVFGVGCLEQLPPLVAEIGKCALVVTGAASLRRAGVTDRVLAALEDAGVRPALYESPGGEPTVEQVDAARGAIAERDAQVVVAIGGGSAVDLGKAAAGLAHSDGPTRKFLDGAPLDTPGLASVAVPTTSGTGSEATPNAVVSDPQRRIKKSIRDPSMLPRAALVDPQLTVGCPASVTAASGMDAFTQAVESFLSVLATPITEALSLEAVKRTARALERAVKSGGDIDARADMSAGSLLAGMALANARLGAVHGMAHALGVRYGVPHGTVCAALLPHVLELNEPHAPEKFAVLEETLGQPPAAFTLDLLDRVGVAPDLKSYDIPRDDFDTIVAESMPSGSLKANPRPFTKSDVRMVLERVS